MDEWLGYLTMGDDGRGEVNLLATKMIAFLEKKRAATTGPEGQIH